MANHTATKKSIRKTAKRTEANSARRSRIRTFIKRVEALAAEGKKEEANKALKLAEPEIMRGVNKGVLKLNTAARKISRLSARVKSCA